MKKLRFLLCFGVLTAAVSVMAPTALAEATRTWVSGVGDDVNPCSRTAPCKTFAGAISKTAARGVINCLDPGGFGAVTITKPITISCVPNAGILAAGVTGVIVNPAAGGFPAGRVILRNLAIEGVGSGITGVKYLSGRSLLLDNVRIYDFTGNGIGVPWTSSTTPAIGRLYVRHSEIDGNGGAGIALAPGTASTAMRVSIIDTILDDNADGIHTFGAPGASRVSISNSEASGNSNSGFFAAAGTINVAGCLVEGNTTGLLGAAGGLMRVASSTITDNDVGVSPSGGSILTRGNNTLEDNVTDGAFSGTYGPR